MDVFTVFFDTVDGILVDGVQAGYQSAITTMSPALGVAAFLSLFVLAYRANTGQIASREALNWIYTFFVIYGVIFSWAFAGNYIWPLVTQWPEYVGGNLVSAVTGSPASDSEVMIDTFFSAGLKLMSGIWKEADGIEQSIKAALYAFLILVSVGLFTIATLFSFIYFKVLSAMLFIAAPVMAIFLLFEPTKGWWKGWLAILVTSIFFYLFLHLLLGFVVAVSLAILKDIYDLTGTEYTMSALAYGVVVIVSAGLTKSLYSFARDVGGAMALGMVGLGARNYAKNRLGALRDRIRTRNREPAQITS